MCQRLPLRYLTGGPLIAIVVAFRSKRSRGRHSLQLVENEWGEGRVRQKVLASLGRVDELQASGQLARLTESLARLTEELEAVRLASDLEARSAQAFEGMLAVARLWSDLGLDSVAWPEGDLPELHHVYRSLERLAGAKDDREVRLHQRARDLFNQELDLAFHDTTSLYFHSAEQDVLQRRGHSKDKRPDLPQAVLGLLLSGDGLPIGHELFPGNTYDGNTVPEVLDRLKERFQLRWLIFVGDRGMVSEKNLEARDETGYDWIVGVRLRTCPQLASVLPSDPRSFRSIAENPEVKEVFSRSIRYVLCRNPDQARRDAARREAVIERLEQRLTASGVKGLLTRSGFGPFLRIHGGEATIDREQVERDARYDGLWVLDTSTDLPAKDVVEAYKSLWRVERAFRTLKSPPSSGLCATGRSRGSEATSSSASSPSWSARLWSADFSRKETSRPASPKCWTRFTAFNRFRSK